MKPDRRQYKFQELETCHLALTYLDIIYSIAYSMSNSERFNITSQLLRAATSIVLNIAEGSTGQSDTEHARFLSMASRSFLETVACLDVIERRNYLHIDTVRKLKDLGHRLFAKLQGRSWGYGDFGPVLVGT